MLRLGHIAGNHTQSGRVSLGAGGDVGDDDRYGDRHDNGNNADAGSHFRGHHEAVVGELPKPALMGASILSHFMYRGVAGAVFAGIFRTRLGIEMGLLWGVVLWLIMEVAVLPFLGWGLFGTGPEDRNLEILEKKGADALKGTPADRARHIVEAISGPRAVWAAFKKTGRIGRIFSSHKSKMEWNGKGVGDD